ncbi:MAG: LCP family protein [Chloroflexi bacterium]|nr:LCP family protein [Chloroflexota bacterium]MDA8186728.1 LCP family protein [Dehalococcoidales bacterium]
MEEDSVVNCPAGQADSQRSHRLRLERKTLLYLLLALIALNGIGGGLILARHTSTIPSSKDQVSSPTQPSEAEGDRQVDADASSAIGAASADRYGIPRKPSSDPRISFLLLGYGGGGHDGAYLTDSIMVAIADPTQKTLTLLSIPRDCWVPLQFDGKTAIYSKINTAYAYAVDTNAYPNRLPRYTGSQGPGSFTADTVSRPLGIPISNYFVLDFQGFREMIDAVGGVDARVPASFAALYPANDDPSIDPSWITVRFTKGVEHMNGERAIEFARARETINNVSEGTDFARSRRQRIIMEAFKSRLLEPGGLIHMPQILPIVARHVNTNYPITAAPQLSQLILEWKDVHIYQTALTTANYLAEGTGPGGAYVLIPSAPDHSWAQIRAFARRLWQEPATGVAMADTRIVVVNNTGDPGLATRLSELLMKLGYRVGTPQPGQERAESRLIDRTGGKAKLVAAQLEKDLGVHFQEVAETPAGNPDELVLDLGANDKSLADLSVPVDSAAPSSAPGVENFQGWAPVMPSPTPHISTTITPTASPSRGSTPRPAASPTGTVTGRGTVPASATPAASHTPATPSATPTIAATATPTVVPPAATPTRTPAPAPHPAPSATP